MERYDQFAFVLVRPKSAGNLGSAARAIKNMGFADLRLIAPEALPTASAAHSMAVHANDVLARAKIFASLDDALADCAISVGTTCRGGLYREAVRPLRESAIELAAESSSNRIAMIFGSEDTGLTNEELKFCQRLITIPTSTEYASINLAQSIILCAYELRMALESETVPNDPRQFASVSDVNAALDRMKDALLAIGFLAEENPEHIMFAIRGIFARSGLTPRELEIISGIASQTRWVAEGGHATLAAKRASGKKLR
ncbi:MAG TPA: RNA methyltransferase [Candidatus Binataceae bacterium]|nr:RNA methyltransferase [Candidatus Binataceae bacterium]